MMRDCRRFYINGQWVAPTCHKDLEVINPANQQPFAVISLSSVIDVDRAVTAPKKAFPAYSETSKSERLTLLAKIIDLYQSRMEEMAETISMEMGAPSWLAKAAQAPAGLAHFKEMLKVLQTFEFEEHNGSMLMRKEPVGVCALITPWNWPMNQVCCKVAPALAAGCTMVLKPSEIAPLSAYLFAEILDQAGVPPGVFNLINGDGATVGATLSSHPGIDMVSFTGSTRAGVAVAISAAPTVKRVTQELGGKSAYIILEDANVENAVQDGVQTCFRNSGQSCDAPTRMLVPRAQMEAAVAVARKAAQATRIGDSNAKGSIGPLVSQTQYDRVQSYIRTAIEEGATLVAGGTGRPEGMNTGFFVRPTIFADVRNDMTIAREEVFGPVLCIISYENEEDAIRIANDTPYGLSGFVASGDLEHARRVAKRVRSGNVRLNGARVDFGGCFGGYKQSGNGREWSLAGLEEFLELKTIFGYAPQDR